MNTDRIVLIGYRGSGKTTVGQLLADRLACTFLDTDNLIQVRLQSCIADIFRDQGELEFRRAEAEVIGQLAVQPVGVISVGGGAVESEQNRRCLRSLGRTVWLTAAAEELHRRIMADPQSARTRPALTDTGLLTEIRSTLSRRIPLYAELAQLIVDTTRLRPASVVEEIVAHL